MRLYDLIDFTAGALCLTLLLWSVNKGSVMWLVVSAVLTGLLNVWQTERDRIK